MWSRHRSGSRRRRNKASRHRRTPRPLCLYTKWEFKLSVDSCWIRDVFWLGPPAPKVLGAKRISNQGGAMFTKCDLPCPHFLLRGSRRAKQSVSRPTRAHTQVQPLAHTHVQSMQHPAHPAHPAHTVHTVHPHPHPQVLGNEAKKPRL